MFRAFSKLMFKLMGWEVEGHAPLDIPKYIVVIAPHTSNWDFIIGVLARSIVRWSNVKYLAKKELFIFPFGIFFRATGGYPVNRTKHTRLVDNVVQLFKSKKTFAIAITPEGTRKKVDRLKTGFYYIASKAGVPMILVGFDYLKKKVIITEPLYATGDQEKDLEKLLAFFKSVTGKVPEKGIT